jgi:aminodeoxyfutalosine deaminase
MGKNTSILYSAPWVLPVTSPVIQNGAVAVKDGRIEAVGPRGEMRAGFGDRKEIECRGVVMPALVNAHIHLELSHLTTIKRPAAGQMMCTWIEDLIQARGDCRLTEQARERHRTQALRDQHLSGAVVLADIGNEAYPFTPDLPDLPLVLRFQEFLAPTRKASEAVRATIAGLPDSVAATAHAPYSTSPEIICALKQRATRLGNVFSMHVAESHEEIEFIRSATGSFRDFLERRRAWEGTFSPSGNDLDGTIMYMQKLGVLDSGTLCVHCVHITENEMRVLKATGAHVCLCPGSNRFLRVGKAPVESLLRYGLLPCLGTDSIASNETLDLWREMQILREEHPGVDPAKVLEMATVGGAAALQCEEDFGSLAPRRKAVFLEVYPEGYDQITSEKELVDILTRKGRPQKVSWMGCR